jgi:2-polyprenyl-3-methyl-5-hydroxy-6-metoxy-1,4-benzoquinol methylase
MKLNDEVRVFWEQGACGSDKVIVGELEPLTKEWYERIEQYRYEVEPFIFSIAQFPRHAGKKLLEVGVGAGTDHLQWARSGVECCGVDLTEAALENQDAVCPLRIQLQPTASRCGNPPVSQPEF